MEQVLLEGFEQLGLSAPDNAVSQFMRYGSMLEAANAVMDLTAITSQRDIARLHFLDSAALLALADFNGMRVADVGCGAGFPGIPLRLLQPDMALTLLDSAGKKIDFCKSVCSALGLTDVDCVWGRAEELPRLRERFDVVVSRAVAQLDVLAELCLPLSAVGGQFIAMKGPACDEEIKTAEFAVKALGGKVEGVKRYTIPGTDIVHAAVMVRKVKNTPEQYPRRFAQIKKKPLRVG